LESWAIPQEDIEFFRSRAWRSQSSIKVIVLLLAPQQSPLGGRISSMIEHFFFHFSPSTAGICSIGFMRSHSWENSQSGIFENCRSHIETFLVPQVDYNGTTNVSPLPSPFPVAR
jgi:hypothetical protein